MPMNNQNYRDMVDAVCEALPGVWQRIGNRQVKQLPVAQAGAAGQVAIALQFPAGDARQGMQIIYRRHDAYIMGYRTTGNIAYACHNQIANVANAQDLRYNDDYATLGWNRQGLAVNGGGPALTVALLDQALEGASRGAITAISLCRIVLALAEGVRFMNVEKAVRGGDRITTDMVDWNQQLADGQAVLRQG